MKSLWIRCGWLLLGMGMLAGCRPVGPESVLEGTWRLETTSGDPLPPTQLIFDRFGDLEKVTINWDENIDIVKDRPTSTTDVDRLEATITADLFLIGTMEFDGTLNEDQTVMTGKLTTNWNFLLVQVTVSNGDAKLTKLP